MKVSRKINKKNRKELLMFCLLVWLSVTPCFAQSQETPTGQQPQQASPSPSIVSTSTDPPLTDKEPSGQPPESRAILTYGADMDFNSSYVWRGILLGDGPVGQPSAWISAFGFTLTAWSSIALTNPSVGASLQMGGMQMGGPPMGSVPMGGVPMGAGQMIGAQLVGSQMVGSRLQTGSLILTYNHDWEKFRMEASLDASLGQPSSIFGTQNTMESSLMLSYPVGPIRIFTSQAFDVLAYPGAYFGEAGLKYERQFKKNTEFSISTRSGWASAKFNNVYIGVNKSAFNYFGVEGSLTYNLGRRMYFQPHIEFNSITDRTLRGMLSPANIVNFGLAFGIQK